MNIQYLFFMIKIRTQDASGILRDFNLPPGTKKQIAKMVQQRLLAEVYEKVVDLANKNLGSTKKQYIDGILISNDSIELEGFIPNAVEDGISGFDMKSGFSKSSKKKSTKSGGWYLTIPFRVFTPGRGSDYRNQMSWQIYRAVRANRKYDAGTPDSRPAFSDNKTGRVWEQYEHKSPILEGIKRTINPNNGRSSYSTFRRVSNNSNPDSWIHTGIMAHRLFDKAWAEVDLEKVIEDSLNSL